MAKYKAYPEYKDSGVEWLGKIPMDWKVVGLKNISSIINGSTPKSGVEAFWNGELNWMTPTDLGQKSGDYIFQSQRKITPQGLNSCGTTLVPANSVILSTRAPIGSLAIGTTEFCTNQGCKSLIIGDASLSKFVYYYLSILTTPLNNLGRGSTFLELSSDDLGSVKISVPNGNITNIIKFLDHQTAKIDNLIEKQQQLIELLKEKRQAVISHAVTKGLNPDAPMKDSGVEWLGEVPEHWKVSRIKNFAKIESGHTPSKTKTEYWVDCNIPWVSLNDSKQLKNIDYIENTFYKISELGMANSSAHLLPARAVIFTRDASIGLSAITMKSMAVSQHLIAWLCDEHIIIPEFLLLIFYAMEKEFERYTFGATLKTIGMDNVKALKAVFPPIEEQSDLIHWAFKKMEDIKNSISKAEELTLLLQERRTALISAAVTGKIDVRDWTPPAASEAATIVESQEVDA
jgi:type I restriction enzyme S subunit